MDKSPNILLIYSSRDDQPAEGAQKGWVTNFHKFLSTLLSQISRNQPEIKLLESSKLKVTDLEQALAAMVVISESFASDEKAVNTVSGWALSEQSNKSLKIDGVSTFLKVVKSPIDVDSVFPDFSDLISYDFYYVDAHTGRMEEFTRFFGSDAEKGFWMKLVDIAYDLAHLMDQSTEGKASKKKQKAVGRDRTVYLASTGMDLLIQRDVIKRELRRHGYEVLPNQSLPKDAAKLEEMVKKDLEKCRMAIHMIGEDYGYRPEGSEKSVVDIQGSVAHEHTMKMSEYNKKNDNSEPFSRLVWLSPDLNNVSERQRLFIEDIKSGAALVEEAEVLQIQLQELKSIIREELITGGRFHVKRDVKGYDDKDEEGVKIVYLIADQRDLDGSKKVEDELAKKGIKVLRPNYDGDLVDIRYVHQQNLKRCDGSIIYYGNATYEWIRTKQFDLMKAPGFGRDKPLRAKAIYIEGTKEIDTHDFEKNKTLVLGNDGNFKAAQLTPFLTKLTD